MKNFNSEQTLCVSVFHHDHCIYCYNPLHQTVNVNTFSSLCWTFGRKLHEYTRKPIGLIEAVLGSGLIQDWASPETLDTCEKYV